MEQKRVMKEKDILVRLKTIERVGCLIGLLADIRTTAGEIYEECRKHDRFPKEDDISAMIKHVMETSKEVHNLTNGTVWDASYIFEALTGFSPPSVIREPSKFKDNFTPARPPSEIRKRTSDFFKEAAMVGKKDKTQTSKD